MRKPYQVLLLAVMAAAFIVPVGFALSIESESRPLSAGARVAGAAAGTVAPHALVASPARAHVTVHDAAPASSPAAEGARLLVVGSAFLGLAAVMRRRV